MDLREDIERDLLTEPVDRFEMEDALRAGRRAVVRRRVLSTLAATAASVAVATGLAVTLNPAGTAATEGRAASGGRTDDCSVPSAGPTSERCAGQQFLDDHPVAYTPSGELVIRDGWSWTFRVTEPLDGVSGTAGSVSDGTDTEWAVLKAPDERNDRFSQYADPADLPPDLTFDRWLEVARARWQGTPTTSLVTYDASGELVAQPGLQIRQQRFDVTFPAGYRGPEGVDAIVEMAVPDRAWFLVRPTPDGAEAFPLFLGARDVEAVFAFLSSPAYDPDRQGMLGETP
jgi:hypothetical protein